MEITKEQHREMALHLNRVVWELLKQEALSGEEKTRLVHAAHASLYHWLQAGTVIQEQRGEWLVSHVYAVLGIGKASLRHAQRCLQLTNAHAEQMADFDRAYGYEGIARAHAVLGHREAAAIFKSIARDLGEQIAEAEDRALFLDDLSDSAWYGIP